MNQAKRVLVGLLGVLALGSLACSPEASRQRGGGPGADIGNRGANVELHGPRRPAGGQFYGTPRIGQGERAQR